MYSAGCLQFIIWILVAEHSKPLNNSCVIAAFLTNFPHVQLVKVNSCLCPRALILVWEYSSVYRDANRTWVREKGKSKSSAKKFVLRKLYQKPFLHCIGDLSRKSIKFRYSRKFRKQEKQEIFYNFGNWLIFCIHSYDIKAKIPEESFGYEFIRRLV